MPAADAPDKGYIGKSDCIIVFDNFFFLFKIFFGL